MPRAEMGGKSLSAVLLADSARVENLRRVSEWNPKLLSREIRPILGLRWLHSQN